LNTDIIFCTQYCVYEMTGTQTSCSENDNVFMECLENKNSTLNTGMYSWSDCNTNTVL